MSNTTTPGSPWWGRIRRAVSFRVIVACVVGAGIVAALTGWAWEPLMAPVFWVLFILLYASSIFYGPELQCPHCKKRLKAGAAVCPKCGRDVPQAA